MALKSRKEKAHHFNRNFKKNIFSIYLGSSFFFIFSAPSFGYTPSEQKAFCTDYARGMASFDSPTYMFDLQRHFNQCMRKPRYYIKQFKKNQKRLEAEKKARLEAEQIRRKEEEAKRKIKKQKESAEKALIIKREEERKKYILENPDHFFN